MNKIIIGCIAVFMVFFLSACGKVKTGPEDIRFDREICYTCSMIISNPAFAAEVRGGEDMKLYKFGDFGEAVLFLEDKGWGENAELWVMDMDDKITWLDARNVHYRTGVVTPMDYGLGAIAKDEKGAIDYQAAVKHIHMRQQHLKDTMHKHEGH